jgi:BA14K-like protein
MSITKKISLTLVAGALAFGTFGASSQANAGGLSKKEAAILAGAGGFVLGAIIGSQNHHAYHHGRVIYVSSWEAHVHRCYARYNTYNEYSDTYISYSGYEKRCRL